jgi:hypothetical protein
MLCSLATKIEDGQLGEVKSLENELGVTVLVFSCMPVDAAELDQGKLARIKQLEDKLGVSLVAVKA